MPTSHKPTLQAQAKKRDSKAEDKYYSGLDKATLQEPLPKVEIRVPNLTDQTKIMH